MNELALFVRDALAAGKGRDEIREALLLAKWPEDEIEDALSRFADVPFPVPVPVRRPSGSAREAFLYLVTFMMLYTAAISLGNLLAGLIDSWMPDPVSTPYPGQESYRNEGLRWLVASLMVSFPVWYLLTRMHLDTYTKNPERRVSQVRFWLTYLTLTVAASTVLITVIVLLAGALGGELLLRTALKSAVVLAIAAGVFRFYLWEVRLGEQRRPQ